MKSFIKGVIFAVLVLALSPFLGFWIVALVGAGLILLPVGVSLATFFPKATESLMDTFRREDQRYTLAG
jgi:hypothetical protein